MKGFKIFAESCSCCHTFFQKGTANVGTPMELVPKKYPSEGSIADYAERPPLHSVMPKQDLTREELNDAEKFIRYKAEEGVLETENNIRP